MEYKVTQCIWSKHLYLYHLSNVQDPQSSASEPPKWRLWPFSMPNSLEIICFVHFFDGKGILQMNKGRRDANIYFTARLTKSSFRSTSWDALIYQNLCFWEKVRGGGGGGGGGDFWSKNFIVDFVYSEWRFWSEIWFPLSKCPRGGGHIQENFARKSSKTGKGEGWMLLGLFLKQKILFW